MKWHNVKLFVAHGKMRWKLQPLSAKSREGIVYTSVKNLICAARDLLLLKNYIYDENIR